MMLAGGYLPKTNISRHIRNNTSSQGNNSDFGHNHWPWKLYKIQVEILHNQQHHSLHTLLIINATSLGLPLGSQIIYCPGNFLPPDNTQGTQNKYSMVVNFIDQGTIVGWDNEKCTALATTLF